MVCQNVVLFPFRQITATRYFLLYSTSHAEIMENSGITFAKIGHIERLKFAGTEMNQHSSKT